jgi:hypothetical protein
MTGHRPFGELTKGFTAQRRARVATKAAALGEAMTLEELRKARALSQEHMAATMAVGQPAVAKLEKRTDMHVSNLRRYIEAMGGTLEITARFSDASVVISNIGDSTSGTRHWRRRPCASQARIRPTILCPKLRCRASLAVKSNCGIRATACGASELVEGPSLSFHCGSDGNISRTERACQPQCAG